MIEHVHWNGKLSKRYTQYTFLLVSTVDKIIAYSCCHDTSCTKEFCIYKLEVYGKTIELMHSNFVLSFMHFLNCTNNLHAVGTGSFDSMHLSLKCSYFTSQISRPCKFLHIRCIQYIQGEFFHFP